MTGMPPAAGKIEIPRWMQLVGLPLLLVLAWVVAGAVRHVVFIFLVAALVALLLNPFVRSLARARVPHGIGVAVVYVCFAAIVLGASAGIATVVDFSTVEQQALARYTHDAGNHVSVTVSRAAATAIP